MEFYLAELGLSIQKFTGNLKPIQSITGLQSKLGKERSAAFSRFSTELLEFSTQTNDIKSLDFACFFFYREFDSDVVDLALAKIEGEYKLKSGIPKVTFLI